MLNRVHEGHLGIDRCKRRARDVMFWDGMSRDVERKVRECAACAEHAASSARESMIPHAVPNLPWRKVGSDIFVFRQKYFLILVDYFSNFIEVSPIHSVSSRAVITAMKDQFARHGVVSELITDNGTAYSSKEFRQFSVDWCFKHTTTSPNYAQANGLSERAVQTVKNIIKKSVMTGSDFYLGLLNLRSTPRDGISWPAQLLMGRRLNTTLPVQNDKLRPERNNDSDFININYNRFRTKQYYDKHSHDLSELNKGDRVIVADGKTRRRRMTVQARAPQPRSYFVVDESGRKYRRNRRHLIQAELRPSLNQSPPTSFDEKGDSDDCVEHGSMYGGSNDGGNHKDGFQPTSASPSGSNKDQGRLAARKAREQLALFFNKK